ncbi:unnamed protein product, partial [Polarella glacialis]
VDPTEPPQLKDGEVRVRVEYTGLQPLDGEMLACAGKFGDLKLPHVMGVEGAGTVLQSRNPAFKAGSRIAFLLRRFFDDESHGCWQSQLNLCPERALLIPVPMDVGLNEAAVCITSTVAAMACLRNFNRGDTIVVTGACGAVGLSLLQLGALRGFRVIGLVRGEERMAWLTQEISDCGSVAVIDMTDPGWMQIAMSVCGRGGMRPDAIDGGSGEEYGGADGVIDGVGGEAFTA